MYLDLSDNLLGLKEVKKIAQVIRQNIGLKVLNLSNNQLCPKCADLISNSLISNTNLLEMNLRKNRIGDTGIASIILPIAKQELHFLVHGIQSSASNIRIKKMDLSYNDHTEEALKHVYALMFASKSIVVDINNPKDNS